MQGTCAHGAAPQKAQGRRELKGNVSGFRHTAPSFLLVFLSVWGIPTHSRPKDPVWWWGLKVKGVGAPGDGKTGGNLFQVQNWTESVSSAVVPSATDADACGHQLPLIRFDQLTFALKL